MRRIWDWVTGWYETLRIPRETRRWLASDFDPADFEDIDRPGGER